MKILVTGGAGFIGSYIVDSLIEKGYEVKIYDSLEPQVHQGKIPPYLNSNAEFIQADICDSRSLDKALVGVDAVYHEAAMVGVGQSMYQIDRYTKTNTYGTAILLDLIVNKHRSHIRKIIVAASMSQYGEGLYSCTTHGDIKPNLRLDEDMANNKWEHFCPHCHQILQSKGTPETAPLTCNSVYALNKKDQEELFIMVGKAYNIPAVALRYFNVFGPRQSLSNPYTGVAAIFISRIKAGNNPVLFEDGQQSRDFVSVHDIAQANLLALESDKANYQTYNVGSGQSTPIATLGQLLIDHLKSQCHLDITRQFRKGDIRHCYADISKISHELGFKPQTTLQSGLSELIEWGKNSKSIDSFDRAMSDLKSKGLL